ncbi:MAG: ATP-binding protein [Lachnospiraceae bacterium]|nr:ATP-binding protein [Lachnospiraceae bacterium]
MLKIIEGLVDRPQKVTIYGAEGVGKTSLAARFPNPLFIDTEGGTSHLDVRRVDKPRNWEELLMIVDEVAATPGICKTLVIDTADWAEMQCIKDICDKYKVNGLESFGYGKGYTYVGEEFARLLTALDRVIAAGMNVVVTAHAKMRKFEQPDEQGSYDRWEMKLSRQVAPLLKEWCDLLLFCNYKTFVVQSDNAMEKAKVQGGKRVMYTTHHPCWDAKNRHGLPNELPLDYKAIASIFTPAAKAPAEQPAEPAAELPIPDAPAELKPIEQLRALMAESGVTDEQVQRVAIEKGKRAAGDPIDNYPDSFITGWLIRYWNRVLQLINAGQKAAE